MTAGRITAGLCIAWAAWSSAGFAAPDAQASFLKNPGFEDGSTNWARSGNAADMDSHQWRYHEGKSCFGFGNDQGPAGAYGEAAQEVEIPGGLSPGDLVIFSAWMQSEDRYSGKAALAVEFLGADGRPVASFKSKELSGLFDWTNVSVTAEAPAGASRVVVKCTSTNMATGRGLSFVWFDETRFDAPVITASSSRGPHAAPANVMKAGAWHSAEAEDQWIQVDNRAARACTGVSIGWDKDYAREYELLISNDGEKWVSAYKATKASPGADSIYLAETSARFLKIACRKSHGGKGFGIESVRLMGPTELVDLKKYFAIAAAQSPAWYPRWLVNQQAYWTGVGVLEDTNEAILCEDGTIEPHSREFSIMPFLYVDNRLVTRDDAKVSQALQKDYLPIPSVMWEYKDVEMSVELFASGKAEESIAYAWYRIRNRRPQGVSGRLFLTFRPFQIYPPWQGGGGFATNKAIAYSNSVVTVNDALRVFPLSPPAGFGSVAGGAHLKFPFKVPEPPELGGDVMAFVRKGAVPPDPSATDPKGFVSSALAWDFALEPGASDDFFVALPLHDALPALHAGMKKAAVKAAVEKMLKQAVAAWSAAVRYIDVDIPDRDMLHMLKANVAHTLVTKDGPAFKPGSRSYNKAWMRDGGMSGAAMLRMGFTREIREFIDWFSTFQFESGEVPPIIDTAAEDPLWEEKEKGLIEYDSQGEFVYTILEVYRFTKDRAFLEGKLDAVVKALKFLVHLRNQTMTAEFKDGPPEKRKYYGILPPSTSHEGYGREYSYWDDFWALKGWKDGRTIFAVLGRDDLVAWADREYNDFKKTFYESMRLTMKLAGLDVIPGSASLADFDPTSTAVAVMYCDELVNLPQPALKNSFDRYYEELRSRYDPRATWRIVPYELRSVPAFLYMGEKDRALELLRFMVACRRPAAWYQVAEVVHSDYRFPTYIGDMPHTWAGGEYLNGFRALFAYETEGRLVLGHGIDEAWLARDEGVSANDLPTYYGRISYTIRKAGEDTLRIKVRGKASAPPRGFVFKIPSAAKAMEVRLNKELLEGFSGDEVVFSRLPAEIVVSYRK